MIKIWKKLVFYCISADPMRIFVATNMVRTSVLGKLRMHKQCTKIAIPLEVVPERRPIFPDHFSKSKTIWKIEKNGYQAKAIALQTPNFAHFWPKVRILQRL